MSTGPSLSSRLLAAALRASGIRNRLFPPAKLDEWASHPRAPYRGMPSRAVQRQIDVRRGDVAGWPVYEIAPKSLAVAKPAGHILYLHGGAYVLDLNPLLYWAAVARLATLTGRTASLPIYPVAPEHTHRDAFPMLVATYRRLLESHDPARIAIVGDSAGGGLSLALCHALREAGLPQPADCVLLSPWLDIALRDPAVEEIERIDPVLNAAHLRECGRRWAAGESLDHPLLSPVNAPLRGLARVTVFAGTRDVLYPDALALRARAAREGVEIGWHEGEGQMHVWMLGFGRDARAALAEVAEVIARRG